MPPGDGSGTRGIGILGGTFDPPHLGHLLIAESARSALDLETVLFLPAGEPWLKSGQQITPARHRRRMVELAIADNADFRICDNELRRSGPSYTVDTLEQLRAGYPDDVVFYFIVGSDVLAQFHRWKEPERVLQLCRLAVVERPGGPSNPVQLMERRYPDAVASGAVLTVSGPRVNFSASEIRQLFSQGISVRYQVPDAITDYIREHGLYQSVDTSHAAKTDATEPNMTMDRNQNIDRLLELALERGALRYGDFTLSSGRKSSYYFDGRLLSLDPEGSYRLGHALLPLLTDAGVSAIGGPTLGADPVVAAVATVSWEQGQPISAFIVRKEAKEHGTAQLIEGSVTVGSTVAIVDDACTTGGSLFHAIAAAEDAGCNVGLVLAILDRNEGGSDAIRQRGYRFASLLAAGDDGQIRPA